MERRSRYLSLSKIWEQERMNPQDLKYSEEHEWVRLQADGTALVGITEFAAESLGDVVFVELPDSGVALAQFEKMGEIESVKAVSDLYSPVGGEVLERNDQLQDSPELVNDGPYDSGWMVKISLTDVAELDNLMSAAEYDAHLAAQE